MTTSPRSLLLYPVDALTAAGRAGLAPTPSLKFSS